MVSLVQNTPLITHADPNSQRMHAYPTRSALLSASSSTAPSRSTAPSPAKTTISAMKPPLNYPAGTPSSRRQTSSTAACLAATSLSRNVTPLSTPPAPPTRSSTAEPNNSPSVSPNEHSSTAPCPTGLLPPSPILRTLHPSSSMKPSPGHGSAEQRPTASPTSLPISLISIPVIQRPSAPTRASITLSPAISASKQCPLSPPQLLPLPLPTYPSNPSHRRCQIYD